MSRRLQTTFQGNAQAFQQSLSTVPLLIAALVVVYLILGILYESYIHPLTILSTLPSAGAGALATLMLFGFDFSLVAMIGVDPADRYRQEERHHARRLRARRRARGGALREAAIRKAALLRFRPIMMTTMAALARRRAADAGHGIGPEIRQPLGYAMVGGLVVSQAMTLFADADHLSLSRPSVALDLRIPKREAAGAEEARARVGAGKRGSKASALSSKSERRLARSKTWGFG